MAGSLHLIPSVISENTRDSAIPPDIRELINHFTYFIVENVRTARRYLVSLGIRTAIDDLEFMVLNKHTTTADIMEYLKLIRNGNDVALLSEAGVPAVADPGSEIIRLAQEDGIRVKPYVGPSSIILALMASGFNGQNFAFNGYLPVKKAERNKAIKNWEKRCKAEHQTQIFIETPYRNMQLLDALLQTLNNETLLCVAANLTAGDEYIRTMPVKEWKKEQPRLHKIPAIFLIYSF